MPPIAHGIFPGEHLIIFGCGYVGGAVARQAIAAGLRVTALTRNPEKADDLRKSGVNVVVDDIAAETWHDQISDGADYVLNAVSSGGGGIEAYRHSYVAGMQSIMNWAASKGPVGTLVYTSSTSVYPQDGGTRVDETAPTAGVGERGQILLEAERVLREAKSSARSAADNAPIGAREPYKRYFILRLAGIYGPGRHHLLEQVRSGEVAGLGKHRLNLVHLEDIVSAIWAAFAAPAEVADEIFNVADDGAAPKSDVTEWLADRVGVLAPMFNGSPSGSRRAVTPDRVIANAKLKNILGWQPHHLTFRQGYEQILAGH